MKRFCSVILICLFIFSALPILGNADYSSESDLAVVFTHDLHSHIEPFTFNGESTGGFARIKTIIDNIRYQYPNTLVLDAGDFSMGTLYQTAFTSEAIEYRLLGDLGYDATTLGNHEFDYGADGFRSMISSAKSSGTSLPPILCANIDIAESGLTDAQLSDLNILNYTIFSRGDYSVAVFGLLGRDAVELSTSDDIVFYDFIDAAKKTVDEIKSLHSPDVIICLSHSGTGDDVKDEDIELAKKVPDINLIISGHSHTYLSEPVIVGNTIIASCGEYGKFVGTVSLDIQDSKVSLASYSLCKVDSSVAVDEQIDRKISQYASYINEYLANFGYSDVDQIVARSDFDFPEQDTMGDILAEQPLGNLISDSYIHAVKLAEGDQYTPVDVSTVPLGVIRASIDKGDITVSQVFEISSLGIGADDLAGYPLCSVYLYGSELWTVAEIDASVSQIMPYAQLYSSGLHYSANTNRMFLNRVYDCWLVDENGNRIEIEDDKLYRVVSGITSARMLGTVKEKSFGLLELTPKDRYGNPIEDFNEHIIRNASGAEVKEWTALCGYLESFDDNKEGIPVIPQKYSAAEGRKNINIEVNISELFTNWNYITWTVCLTFNIIICITVTIVIVLCRKVRKKKSKLAESASLDE